MHHRLRLRRPSPAMLIAIVALVSSFAGPALANQAVDIAKKAKLINGSKIKARSIAGGKLKNDTVTGTQLNESSLGQVPKASTATTAGSATTAITAATASNAVSLEGKSLNQVVMWAVVNTDGTLNRSSGSGISSALLGTGNYRVTFPIDVNKCVYNVNGGGPGGVASPGSLVKDYGVVANDSADTKSVVYAMVDAAGAADSEPGFLSVHC